MHSVLVYGYGSGLGAYRSFNDCAGYDVDLVDAMQASFTDTCSNFCFENSLVLSQPRK